MRWLKPIMQLRLAVLLASIAISYPILRATDSSPISSLSKSLQRSIKNVRTRPNCASTKKSCFLHVPRSAFCLVGVAMVAVAFTKSFWQDTSITDGLWILTFGQFGLAGFLAQFGLLVLPVFRSITALRRVELPREKILVASLALIVAMTVIEQLPNASLGPWNWLLVGALLGRTERILSAQPQTRRPKLGRPAVGLTS